ncbi:hypothetical protein [Acinetobacter bereziniae]|uniref:hypothetical protein n=1 Tax=Acinetobacter bereziniae TaxID=106648 RepID=UPI0006654319|nr:hypothetical protein [Acinetobacter bereziniae]
MAAAKQNLRIEQGATFRLSLQWIANTTPVNLTGYKARMQIRNKVSSPEFIYEMTTENGGITFKDVEGGHIQLFISNVDTSSFAFDSAVYDLEFVAPNGDVTRLIEGKVTLSLEVTRD